MDIYMGTGFGQIGDQAMVRVWSDAGGQPGSLLSSFTETVSIVDNVGATSSNHRLHVDFTTPYILNGGTDYWIGMSGTGRSLTQTGINGGTLGAGNLFQFDGITKAGFASSVGHMAFRLEGEVSAVPEPSTIALACTALPIGLGLAWKRRRKAATA